MKVLLEDTICLQKIKFYCVCVLLGLLFVSVSALFLLKPSQQASFVPIVKEKKELELSQPVLTKNLTVKPRTFPLFFPDMKKEIQIFIEQCRPDTPIDQISLQICLSSSQEKKTIKNTEGVFLELPQTKEKKFHFSQQPTPIFIKATYIDLEKIQIQLSVEKEKFPEITFPKKFSTQFFISPEQQKESLEKEDFFSTLSSAKWWGKDEILCTIFPEQQEQQRLELRFLSDSPESISSSLITTPSSSLSEASSTILMIKEKDFCIWKDQHWQKIASLDKAKGFPLANVLSIGPDKLEIFVWNETGEKRGKISLSLQKTIPLKKEENFLTDIRLRSQNQLSVKLEKQRVLLRTKDFAYRKSGRWKVVKKIPFSENFDFLFFLEKILEEAEGKSLVGYLFDSSHTQKEEIKIFIPSLHNKRASKRVSQRDRSKPQKSFSSEEVFSEAFQP